MAIEILPVGTRVKCFDFFRKTDCYLIGIIEYVDGEIYTVTREQQVIEGVSVEPKMPYFITPAQGAAMMDDVWTRIEVLS